MNVVARGAQVCAKRSRTELESHSTDEKVLNVLMTGRMDGAIGQTKLESRSALADRLGVKKYNVTQKLHSASYSMLIATRDACSLLIQACIAKCKASRSAGDIEPRFRPFLFLRKRKYDGARIKSTAELAPSSDDPSPNSIQGAHEIIAMEAG